jgi:predicted metal-dependent hydrolase
MSETNGKSEDWRERLDRVTASHVQLMTDVEIFRREHAAHVRRHDEFERQYDERREQDRKEQKLRDEKIDARIDKLVSAIGEFMRRTKDAA